MSTVRTSRQLATKTAGTAGAAPEQYSKALRWLHLGLGAGVATCFATVNIAQQTKDKELKGQMMNLHKSTALLVAAGVVARIGVRLTSAVPAHLPGPKPVQLVGSLTHAALYGFMVVMPATGIAMGYFGGKGLPFFGTTIPGATEKRGDIAKQAFGIHKQAGVLFEGLVALHFAGAVSHAARGQAIFARINPFV